MKDIISIIKGYRPTFHWTYRDSCSGHALGFFCLDFVEGEGGLEINK